MTRYTFQKLVLTIVIAIYTTSASAENFKVGALLCLTSSCADTGHYSLQGIQLAISEIEKSTGDKIELIVENSNELNGSSSVTAYQALRRKLDKAFIIGPSWSIGGMTIAPIAAKDKDVLLISPSLGVKEFNETGENIFCIWPHDEVGTRALAKRAFTNGQKRFAVVTHLSPWELSQAKTFKEEIFKLGGTIDPYIEYQMSESDLKGYAAKIIKSKPDAVYLSNYTQLGVFAKELIKYGYKGPKYASYLDPIQLEQAQGTLEGVEFSLQPEASEDFSTKYKNMFNEKAGVSADAAYDALNLIYKSIKETKSTEPSVVSKHILTIKNYQGASGDITFDEKGGITRDPTFFVLKGTTYERIQ